MKIAKYSISVILFIIFFLITMIVNSYYIMGYEHKNTIQIETNDEMDIGFLIDKAEKYDLVLHYSRLVISKQNKKYLKNYVSEKKYDFLISEIGIPSGKYNNPMFDEITVTYNDLKKISTEQNDWNFHIYNGTKDKIKKFSDELSLAGYANIVSYAPSYANVFYYVPYFVLIFSEVMLLIITYVEICSKKKEIMIRYIHGERYLKSVITSIFSDAVFYIVISVTGWLFLKRYTRVCKIFSFFYIFLIIFILINSAVTLSVLKTKSREIIYGHQYSTHIILALKVLKISGAVISFCIMAFTVITIPEIRGYKQIETIFKNDMDKVFVDFCRTDNINIRDPIKLKLNEHYKLRAIEKILHETDESFEPVYLSDISNYLGNGRKVIYCNFRAEKYLKRMIPEAAELDVTKYECVLLLPEIMNETSAQQCKHDILEWFNTVEGFVPEKINVITYKDPVNTVSFTSEHDFSSYISPCICITGDTFNSEKYSEENANHHYLLGYGIYGNVENMDEKFKEYDYRLSYSTVSDMFKSKFVFYKNLIVIAEVSVILLLIFQMMIIISLVKLEYKINGMELAVKKILGHSIVKKNRSLFESIMISFVINIILFCILFIIFKVRFALLFIAVSLCVMECAITFLYIISEEKRSIVKTLKGGAL